MTSPSVCLRSALVSRKDALTFLQERGYSPSSISLPPPEEPDPLLLSGTLLQSSLEPKAPRLFFVWNDKRSSQGQGQHLRKLQNLLNEYARQLSLDPETKIQSPDLGLVACPSFLLLFPLSDPSARRLRFTPDNLTKEASTFAQRFSLLSASNLAKYALLSEPLPLSSLERVRQKAQPSQKLRYDYQDFFAGEQFDREFVQAMALARRNLLQILLAPDSRTGLLRPVLEALHSKEGTDWLPADLDKIDGFPTPDAISKRAFLRSRLIATADTVLLRLILYRYLEAQYGLDLPEGERKAITFGTTYDRLLQETSRIDAAKIDNYTARSFTQLEQSLAPDPPPAKKGKNKRASASAPQLDLFGLPPVEIHNQAALAKGIETRNDAYQRQAGGDLHQGQIADAANLLDAWLRDHRPQDLAFLLHSTSADRYTFAYEDLDPRAFQRFYETTIGTDIRLRYDKDTEKTEVLVQMWHQNRKEQGAFFTREELASWLVSRTLGLFYQGWKETFDALLKDFLKSPSPATADPGNPVYDALFQHLESFTKLTILDPTVGGGIFLRTAFDFLSACHAEIARFLTRLPLEVQARLCGEGGPFAFFSTREGAQGEWQWHILLWMLYGVDVDLKAINVASNLLTLSALAYKPQGLCFPSFINTSLKRGNAFVNPLPPERRADFLKEHHAELLDLLALRKALRDPNLERRLWQDTHAQAHKRTQEITALWLLRSFRYAFPGLPDQDLLLRIQRAGSFLYEAEFPEIFFEPDPSDPRKPRLRLRENPGFSFLLGNPPWEEPASELKHFLPEFEPAFRDLKGPEASVKERELLAKKEIALRWERHQQSVEDFRTLLASGIYKHQIAKVRGKAQGAHSNLYKYATELAHGLLQKNGYAGLVLDSGLWNDLSATGLRRLLFDSTRVLAICGFINEKGIFEDIHRSYKFSCNVFQKGGRTEAIPLVFMRDALDDLEKFDSISFLAPLDTLRQDASGTYALPEVRSSVQFHTLLHLSSHPTLFDPPWEVEIYSREFNAGEQRHFFLPKRKGLYPLVQGTQFNLWGVHQGEEPEFWLDPSMAGAGGFLYNKQRGRVLQAIADWLEGQGKLKGTKEKAALEWIEATAGAKDVPREWVRLDWEGYRIAWRDITNATNKRTLIAAILPKGVGVSHTAPTVQPFRLRVHSGGVEYDLQYEYPRLLYLAGVLSSFACDSLARARVAKTHLTANIFQNFNVPVWEETKEQERVAELAGRLTCLPATTARPWAEYGELAGAVGLDPAKDGLLGAEERAEAEAELNARVAGLYGLGREEVRYLMDELFMTPQHKAEHERMRDRMVEKMPD